jgi:hypothetical protein
LTGRCPWLGCGQIFAADLPQLRDCGSVPQRRLGVVSECSGLDGKPVLIEQHWRLL